MNMAICLWRKRRIVRAEVGYIGAARGTTVLPSALLPGQSANRLWAIVDEQMKNRDVEIEPGLELLERLPSNDDAALTRGAALSAAFLMMLCTANQAKSHDIENLIPPEWTCATFVKFVDGVAALSGISRAALIKSASTTALGVIEFRRRRALDEEHQSARDRANVLPHERQIDVLIRYQAQIDRSFARDLQHLELLQRLRNGQEVAPPTRVQVEVDRDEAVGE